MLAHMDPGSRIWLAQFAETEAAGFRGLAHCRSEDTRAGDASPANGLMVTTGWRIATWEKATWEMDDSE